LYRDGLLAASGDVATPGIGAALLVALEPANLFACLLGAVLGTVVGVLPGLGPAGAMALVLPLTI
jgi:putative tricarboxylic transport membrane protein